HNLGVYGVDRSVRVLVGDARELLGGLEASLVFVDPPWGEDWKRAGTQLDDLPLLGELLAPARATGASELWVKVPPSFATNSLPGAEAHAYFGQRQGDDRRVKFVLLRAPLER